MMGQISLFPWASGGWGGGGPRFPCQTQRVGWQSSLHLLFQDFVAGLSVILRGTIDDRLNWAFNLYDLNKDGCITKEVQGHRGQEGWRVGALGGDVQRDLISGVNSKG